MIEQYQKPTPALGVYHDVPFGRYQQWDAWNPSRIKTLVQKSARALRYELDHGHESTPSMDLGRATHTLILEPDKFAERYAIYYGDGTRASKDFKAFAEDNAGKEIFKASEIDNALGMAAAINADPVAGPIIARQAQHEVSVVWQSSGLLCKGRIDRLEQDGSITDLKTCADPYPRKFGMSVVEFGYHLSVGAYRAGLRANGIQVPAVRFIAVQNKPPYEVVVYEVSAETLAFGHDEWTAGLQRVKQCLDTGIWPGYETQPVPFFLPEWAVPETQVTYEEN